MSSIMLSRRICGDLQHLNCLQRNKALKLCEPLDKTLQYRVCVGRVQDGGRACPYCGLLNRPIGKLDRGSFQVRQPEKC
jgi:hypothetical protein